MTKEQAIKLPDTGTYKGQLFRHWSNEFRQSHADHVAYIALHLGGVLEACRSKFATLLEYHRTRSRDAAQGQRHQRAIARLQNTMTGAAMSYETNFRRH